LGSNLHRGDYISHAQFFLINSMIQKAIMESSNQADIVVGAVILQMEGWTFEDG
jgi:hypothetical protein